MGLFDRFTKPKWQHENPDVRFKAVQKLDDQEILIKMAKTDSDEYVRMRAVKEINDESVLTDIVKNDESEKVREEAVKKINDEAVLTDIAKNYEYSPASVEAIKKINDESVLTDIAKTNPDFLVRLEAIDKINDESVLTDIAKTDPHDYVRDTVIGRIGIENITDESILEYINERDQKNEKSSESKQDSSLNEKVRIRTYANDFFDAVEKKDIMAMDKKSMEWNDEFPDDANAIISKAVVLSMSNGDPLIIKKILTRAKNYNPLDEEWYDFYYSGIANILEDECRRIEKELYG